jgi:ELWxxDGT repeat protein
MLNKIVSSIVAIAALCAPLSQRAQAAHAAPNTPFALVKDIQTTPQPVGALSGPGLFVTLGEAILFNAHTPQTGAELWRTDGTEAGTRLVKDIQPGEGGAVNFYGSPSVVLNGALLFTANDGAIGRELWRTDGTPAGTTLLKDTWPGAMSGLPVDFHVVGGRAFFTTRVSEDAYGLWITDGASAGTTLLKTFTEIGTFISLNGALLFGASESGLNRELWRSDGTLAGTTLVKDINPGPQGSYPTNLTVAQPNELVVFSAFHNALGRELWRTDGTPAGTQIIPEINLNGGSDPSNIVEVTFDLGQPNLLHGVLFVANDGMSGRELWYTDGYSEPGRVRDARPGPNSSDPVLLATNDCTYQTPTTYEKRSCPFFSMTDGTHGRELWRSDVTEGGTVLLKDIYTGTAGSNIGRMVQVGETFFFDAANQPSGRELWKTNGSSVGTVQVADIYSGTQSSNPTYLTAFNGRLYFIAEDGVHGEELWRSDGTPAGTAMVKDIWPGSANGVYRLLGVALGALYFVADDGATGAELWKTDGTEAGTKMVKNIAPDAGGTYVYPGYNVAALGDRLVMGVGAYGYDLAATSLHTQAEAEINAANQCASILSGGGQHASEEAVTFMAAEVEECDVAATPPHPSTSFLVNRCALDAPFRSGCLRAGNQNNAVAATTSELWVSDGTNAGTTAIRSFPSFEGDYPYALTALRNGVLFAGTDSKDVVELWRTDGTATSTNILGSVVKPNYGYVSDLTWLNDIVIFRAVTQTMPGGNRTDSLWKSDGTPLGTQLIKPSVGYGWSDYAASGNVVFFDGAPANSNDHELWKTDGSEAGTIRVKDIYSGTNGSYPRAITPGAPGSIFFIAEAGDTGFQLWKSDGSEGGTVLVHDVRPIRNTYEYGEMAYVNGTMFFVADDGANGMELWRSDGTTQGTALLADIYPGYGASYPEDLIGFNGALYFSATGPDGKRTLWRSDGTPAGTQPVRSDAGAPLNPYAITVIQGQLMFSAADETHGREAWASDGTPVGTTLIQDVWPGVESSNPYSFIETTKHTYFSADTPGVGREMWARPIGGGPTPGGRKTYLPLVTR